MQWALKHRCTVVNTTTQTKVCNEHVAKTQMMMMLYPLFFVFSPADFSPDELALLESVGASFAGLGSNRLRVETAALALLTGVQLLEDSESVL